MKPWPSDAVIIICSEPHEAKTEKMESVNPGVCRDCGRTVVYDGWSMRRASQPEFTRGRPVELLCIPCCVTYDAQSITHFEDHRRREASKT
jgi:hypothetical protein